MNSIRTDYAIDNTGRDLAIVFRYQIGQHPTLLAFQEGITVEEVEAIIAAHTKEKL
jgi:hypothetical protein